MNNKLEIFKKKLIYRAGYRGTKEMDILLSGFVNKYINNLDDELLYELDKFLNFEDEIILDFYNHNINKMNIKNNKISKIFKNFKLYGGEVGFEPTNELPRWFSRPVLSTLSHLSLNLFSFFNTILKIK